MPQTVEQEQEIRAAMLDMAKAAGLSEQEFDDMRAALEPGATLADVIETLNALIVSLRNAGFLAT